MKTATKKLFSISLIISTVLVSNALLAEKVTKKESLVKELKTKQDFKDALKNEHIAIKVYADWCGACKYAAPHFEKAAEVHKKDIAVYKLNADGAELRGLVSAFGVTGLPTVVYVRVKDQKDPQVEAWAESLTTIPAGIEWHKEVGAKQKDQFIQDFKNWFKKEAKAVEEKIEKATKKTKAVVKDAAKKVEKKIKDKKIKKTVKKQAKKELKECSRACFRECDRACKTQEAQDLKK